MRIRRGTKDLLFVQRKDGGGYSEFHMSSGERSVLRLSLELARLRDALVLIDEVEAGLHPFTQQVLMIELQRLALRNRLQIVVATHSAVVLESVPVEGRIFLDRQGDNVDVVPPYHDVIPRACTVFAQFRKLWSTIFVLDGDGQNLVAELESMAQSKGQVATVICLPWNGAPELWAWHAIEDHPRDYAQRLGFSDEAALQVEIQHISQTYEGAADSESNKAKGRIWALTQAMGRDVPALMRMMGRIEAERDSGELASVLADFRDAVLEWRNMRGDS